MGGEDPKRTVLSVEQTPTCACGETKCLTAEIAFSGMYQQAPEFWGIAHSDMMCGKVCLCCRTFESDYALQHSATLQNSRQNMVLHSSNLNLIQCGDALHDAGVLDIKSTAQ